MDFQLINNMGLAVLAGFISSPHCVIMCGPIAILLMKGKSVEAGTMASYKLVLVYHIFRILAFTFFGAAFGALGIKVVSFFEYPVSKLLPWALAIFFILFGLGADKWLPKPKFLGLYFNGLSQKALRLPKFFAAMLLGLMTPLMPCGPLYMIFWVSLFTGSMSLGGQIALGYGLGTLPLMWLAQMAFFKFSFSKNQKLLGIIRRIMALGGGGVLLWRMLVMTGPLSAELCGHL